jgi:hypothetical protein
MIFDFASRMKAACAPKAAGAHKIRRGQRFRYLSTFVTLSFPSAVISITITDSRAA